MNEIASVPTVLRNDNLSWKDNLSIQKLLDAIVSILVEEYIQVAKQNPAVFSEIASGTSCPRNDQR